MPLMWRTDRFMALLLFLCALVILYLFLIRGRSGHKELSKLRKWRYAHRGLHGNEAPENSMSAFCNAVNAGYGIELDVHLMQDGNLAVLHDGSLKRTAGTDVIIEDLSAADLERYLLQGTEETIPMLHQVLSMVQGRVPLIL